MSHLVVFGEINEKLREKIFALRKKVRELNYDTGDPYTYTVPHLTLATNPNFQGEVGKLKTLIQNINVKKFHLTINDIIVIDNNIAIKFDNSFSAKLAKEITFALRDFNFDSVDTYFMKLIRSEVKPEFREKVMSMVREIIPDNLDIVSISASGGNLTQDDIYWSIKLIE